MFFTRPYEYSSKATNFFIELFKEGSKQLHALQFRSSGEFVNKQFVQVVLIWQL